MSNEQKIFLRRILMRAREHELKIKALEKAVDGVFFEALQFEVLDDVLDLFRVPYGEKQYFHNRWYTTKKDDPEKVDKFLRDLEIKSMAYRAQLQ